MDDSQVHGRIEELVADEHELWQREAAGNASDAAWLRLKELKLSRDQFWDLLARCATQAAIQTRPVSGGRKWSSATSGSGDSANSRAASFSERTTWAPLSAAVQAAGARTSIAATED